MKTGIELIAQEREEQIEKHGKTVQLDVATNQAYQLSVAAARLVLKDTLPPAPWDFNVWEGMMNKTYKQRLIIAGALIAAEIDRLQYNPSES